MIDSINFIINNVSNLDTKRLCELNIIYYKLRYTKGNNGKTYVVYGDTKQETDPDLISRGIGFKYYNLYFRYLASFNCIVITANTHKVLNKTNILLSDRDKYINNIKYIVETVLGIDYSKLNLHRIDYYVDIEMDYNVMYEYLKLLEKHKSVYQHIKRINEYESSIYLTSMYGEKRINIYDKYKCEKDKYYKAFEKAHKKSEISLADYEMQNTAEYDKYKNIFRIEVQNTKKLIKKEATKLLLKYNENIAPILSHKINKSLYGYWNRESMETYFFNFLRDFLYTSKYYNLNIAKQKIEKAKEYKDSETEELIELTDRIKAELKEFIEAVNKYGISGVTQSKNKNDHPRWCGATINTYTKNLKGIGIDLWLIDINRNVNLKNEINKINKSSYSNNWKSKLKQFVKAVNKYGVAEVTANNNYEVTTDSNYSKHEKWCIATVKKYIKILNAIGINPVTLDNNSKYNSLDSLYNLAKKVANEKYFDTNKLNIPLPAPVQAPKQKSKQTQPKEQEQVHNRRNYNSFFANDTSFKF